MGVVEKPNLNEGFNFEPTDPVDARKVAVVNIKKVFTYQPPKPGQPEKYHAIREAAKSLALVILDNSPICADQTAAIRKVREAVMTANAAIALDGVV